MLEHRFQTSSTDEIDMQLQMKSAVCACVQCMKMKMRFSFNFSFLRSCYRRKKKKTTKHQLLSHVFLSTLCYCRNTDLLMSEISIFLNQRSVVSWYTHSFKQEYVYEKNGRGAP